MEEKFLPIGTVVLLKNATKEIMITGYLTVPNDNQDKVYDYSACLYPEGIITSEQTAVFNHDQIDQIISIGYENEECKNFIKKVKEFYENQKEDKEIRNFINSIETLD